MYRKLYYGPTKPSSIPKDKDIRKDAPYSDDYIMENGVKLTLRTYKLNSKLDVGNGLNDLSIYAGDVVYLLNNKPHRMNGPAFIRKNDIYIWIRNGLIHRDGDEPAYETQDDSVTMWYKNGDKHREYGPAVFIKNNSGIKAEYWLNGEYIETEEEFINDVRNSRLKDMLGILETRKKGCGLHQTLYLHSS